MGPALTFFFQATQIFQVYGSCKSVSNLHFDILFLCFNNTKRTAHVCLS